MAEVIQLRVRRVGHDDKYFGRAAVGIGSGKGHDPGGKGNCFFVKGIVPKYILSILSSLFVVGCDAELGQEAYIPSIRGAVRMRKSTKK